MKIVKVESTQHTVKITLENGVEASLTSNNGYFHFNASRVQLPMKVSHVLPTKDPGYASTSNLMNIYYEKAGD